MTAWHRFWFPGHAATPAWHNDAALWSPQAAAEAQRSLWQQAARSTEAWWRFWQVAWPGPPLQAPIGVVVPPVNEVSGSARVSRAAASVRKASAAPRRAVPARAKPAASPPRPRHGLRGK